MLGALSDRDVGSSNWRFMNCQWSLGRLIMPYTITVSCDRKIEVLNRDYMPMFPETYTEKKVSDRILESCSFDNKIFRSDNHRQIWLYDDATQPWYDEKDFNSYMKKIHRLMKIRTTTDPRR